MPGEKVEVTQQPATQADINAFIRGDGNEWQDGSRFQASAMGGMGSGVLADIARLEAATNPQPQVPLTQERLYETSPPQEVAGGQNFQQLYGQSENEKGRWRRTAEEALAELQAAKQELQNLRNLGASAQYATPGYAGAQPYANAPQQPPQQMDYSKMLPETFFPGRDPNTVPEVHEIDGVMRNVLGPAVLQLWQQQQELQKQQIAASKANAGITPAVEQRLYSVYPWLQNVADGPARIQAMQDVLRQAQGGGTSPVSPAASAPQAMVNPVQAAARRVTYIESGSQGTSAAGVEEDVSVRIAREYLAAKTSADKKAVLMKYGMNQVNDFGPGVYTR